VTATSVRNPTLNPDQTRAVLSHLQVNAIGPTVAFLDDLVCAYIRKVPWESAFRIAKRARTKKITECPRWPEEFWRDNLERGGGGTCFESNYAFFTLLNTLGYQGYLTINDMDKTRRCHSAIVLNIDGKRWLVDVGIPLHAPIPVVSAKQSRRASKFHNYTLTRVGRHLYQIERDRHPSPYIYTLIDEPIEERAYRQATTADYGENGFFLKRMIINKIIDERGWRFNSEEKPYHLESFGDGGRTDQPIEGDVAAAVAVHFEMDVGVVRKALDVTETR
jgi:arylamine N-acetyltransferase